MLPKIICFDCQKLVEQFNSFRIKCNKAEEKLYKLLSVSSTNKLCVCTYIKMKFRKIITCEIIIWFHHCYFQVTQIKQEYLDTDCHENYNAQIEIESFKDSDSTNYNNLNIINNLKLEVVDENETNYYANNNKNQQPDLIQIISEQICNRSQSYEDVKQPQIEIITENIDEKLKIIDVQELTTPEFCDIKVIPEILLKSNSDNFQDADKTTIDHELQPIEFVEIKTPFYDIPEKLNNVNNLSDSKCSDQESSSNTMIKDGNVDRKKTPSKKNSNNLLFNEKEVDEKYLRLAEGEVCNIDIEEMQAVIKKKQNPNAKLFCKKCNKSFKSFKCLKKHKNWHDSMPDIFICEICKNSKFCKNYEFSSLKSLNCHLNRKHGSYERDETKKHECKKCNKILFSQGELNAHYKKTHDETGAFCQICGKKFKNKLVASFIGGRGGGVHIVFTQILIIAFWFQSSTE